MLFATYGAPAPPRGKNPLLIVLGVCGGCVLLVIIGVVVMGAIGVNMLKGVTSGAMDMVKNMPAFLSDLKAHDYTSAEALVDPAAQDKLTADKLKSMEESMEKKLGPMESFGTRPIQKSQNQVSAPGSNGQPTTIEQFYTMPVKYKKGNATATFKFVIDMTAAQKGDLSKMKMSGKINDFKLSPDSQ